MGFFLSAMAAFLISFAYIANAMPTADTPRLAEPETANIALRWLSIFETDMQGQSTGAELINSTLTPEFQFFDEGASFGDPGPVLANRAAVFEFVTASGAEPPVVNIKFEVLYIFSSCDVIGARWKYSALSWKGENVTVPVGSPISYLGTEYLQVDLDTRMIYNVTCSADLLNYYKQIGYDILASS